MSAAAALLDRLGRPGTVRLGSAATGQIARLTTGLAVLDAALEGGLPRGRVTELAGARSAGRTGLACRIAASATSAGETIAWVDPDDALDPEAAAAAGVALARVLWVRPRDVADAFGAAEILLGAGGFGLVVLDLGSQSGPPAASSSRSARRPARLTSWTRLARAAERTRSTLLVLAAASRTGSPMGACAALRLELTGRRARWSGGPGRRVLLDGVTARLTVARSRGGGAGRTLVVRQACA
jgi:RecA/RadA recombinase